MGASITGIIGGNGDGKTLCAVATHAIPQLNAGKPVCANFHIDHPLAFTLTSWRQIENLEHCLFILDEISTAFPSRGSQSLPPELMRLIHQLRKPDVPFVWTAVNWARADVALREATKRVTICQGSVPDKWERQPGIPPLWRPFTKKLDGPDGKAMKRIESWDANSLFKWTTYNAQAFDEFTLHAIKDLKPIKRQWYWRPWHDADHLYDTLEQVPLLDNVSETGTCLNCGGRRRRPTCHCKQPALVRDDAHARADYLTPTTEDDDE